MDQLQSRQQAQTEPPLVLGEWEPQILHQQLLEHRRETLGIVAVAGLLVAVQSRGNVVAVEVAVVVAFVVVVVVLVIAVIGVVAGAFAAAEGATVASSPPAATWRAVDHFGLLPSGLMAL